MPIPLGFWATAGASSASAGAYELISSTILGSATSSVTFSSIPSTYKHLQIRFQARSSRSTYDIGKITFNSDTGPNYSIHNLFTSGGGVASESYTSNSYLRMEDLVGTNDTVSAAFPTYIMDILDYASTNKNKTTRMLQTASLSLNFRLWLSSGGWYSTSAINSITFAPNTGPNFVAGSRFSLYGIKG